MPTFVVKIRIDANIEADSPYEAVGMVLGKDWPITEGDISGVMVLVPQPDLIVGVPAETWQEAIDPVTDEGLGRSKHRWEGMK